MFVLLERTEEGATTVATAAGLAGEAAAEEEAEEGGEKGDRGGEDRELDLAGVVDCARLEPTPRYDGFVVGDWNGHGQVAGCTNGDCAQALIAEADRLVRAGQLLLGSGASAVIRREF